MNDKEILTPWKPIEGFTYDYYIYSVCSDSNGLKVILDEISDGKRSKVVITFPKGVVAYRMTDEFITMNSSRVESEPNKNATYVSCASFKIKNSKYYRWAVQSLGCTDEELDLIHFEICTVDWILEILSAREPIVEFINIP